MNKIKHNLLAYFSAFVLTIVYSIYGTVIMSVIMKIRNYQVENLELTYALVNIIIAATIVGILLIVKGKFGKFTFKSYFVGLGIYALPIVLFSVFYFTEAVVWTFGKNRGLYPSNLNEIFFLYLIYYISVAIVEELCFRTAVVNCLFRKKSFSKVELVIGCIYSGILFGGVHIMNIFTAPEMEMKLKIYTILYGCLIGFVYTVLYLRTKNIFVPMTLHFMWDITTEWNTMMIYQKFRTGGEYSFLNRQIPIIILMTIIAIVILCKSKSEDFTLCTENINKIEKGNK